MSRETSTQKQYVYTGPTACRTEDGLRTNIDGGDDTSRPFVASVGWLQRHAPIRHLLKPLDAYKADKVKAQKAKQPTKAKAEEKPAKAAKTAPKKAPKTKE